MRLIKGNQLNQIKNMFVNDEIDLDLYINFKPIKIFYSTKAIDNLTKFFKVENF